ncbi:MAG: hypothetical protein ABI625_14160 [bacterium]
MRTMLSFVSPLAAAAILGVTAASPAIGQTAVVAEHVRPIVKTDTTVRTVAVYKFSAARQAGMPAEVTVADSAGVLKASFRLPGSDTVRPMMVDVLDAGIVLQGRTTTGVLTLVLYQKEATNGTSVVGMWTLGTQDGELLGHAIR